MSLKRELLDGALKREGFAGLDNQRDLFNQISTLLYDHEDFRQLLMKAAPEKRRLAYDSLAPRLMFKAKGFEDYMVEQRAWASDQAARKEQIARAPGLPELARQAIEAASEGSGTLTVTCAKCTRQADFEGETRVAATLKARNAGWVYDPINDREICPKCPAPREEVN